MKTILGRTFCVQKMFLFFFLVSASVWGGEGSSDTVSPSVSAKPVVIGVLSFRPKPQTLVQWKPLETVLKQAIPEHDFIVEPLTFSELNKAVSERRIDFVLTNPVNYILLQKRAGLSLPLTTLAVNESGRTSTVFGGVIFTRADHRNIKGLEDLKGKTIAATDTESMGGYQMQMYELHQAGIRLENKSRFIMTGMPHDNVVKAVLSGTADVGFVRSGVLEHMVREGDLKPEEYTIIHRQSHPEFPVDVSTRLYPEWPLAALPGIDEALARHVTAALFKLNSHSPYARAMQIDGFTLHADYTPVENMLRELHLPPFDREGRLTLKEVWNGYRWQITAMLLMLVFLGLLVLIRLLKTHRKLKESEAHLRAIVENEPECIKIVDEAGYVLHMNPAGLAMLEADELEQVAGYPILDRIAPEYHEAYLALHKRVLAGESMHMQFEGVGLHGTRRWFESHSVPMQDHGKRVHLAVTRDITEQKEAEDKLHLAANVFVYAREAIVITATDGTIIDVNDAFSRITGYSRDEVLGLNPRFLSSGRQDKKFYAEMWSDLIEHSHWYGEIWNRRKNGEVYAEMLTISAVRDGQGIIQQYVALFSDITQLKENEDHLKYIAHYDVLTDLPNRVLLAERMTQAMALSKRHSQPLAVVFLDFDNFKEINDHYGHAIGDKLLIALAGNMRGILREGDLLSRWGGDEFVAVLMDQSDIKNSDTLFEQLLAATSEPIYIDSCKLQISVSLGVTFYPQAEEVDADQLLRQADQAMYQAKLLGKNRYHIFDTEQDRSIRGYHEDIVRFRQALENNEFILYYQPKVNMRTGAVIGVEALIRWQHPEKGILPPGLFLPIIENHRLAIDLGEWVINAALEQIERWHQEGFDIRVSVNISANQLQEGNFTERLHQIVLAHPNVNHSSLEIEILETSALEDLTRTAKIIESCRDIGVSFALDDFGTGYSSLTYLKQLPVSLIKIDQSFVRDMLIDSNDLNILEGVISLANAFHRQVIAEGVETLEHGKLLLQLGCELAQGYAIARPMPAEEVQNWTNSWKSFPEWRRG
ncbi:MAG: EAL domain-containing protein [Sulfuricurvum sp.]|uniref:EAL domain-containing protein n=1 Tax=Sulfuricurvum sp. TaxID=2025608 RepID=UPI0025FCD4AA|nr:EAL domain-containing protein [Sulfuricurvum sp.]MCK9373782.1 EAL domain-containing protein [Sulfuricurvum sp.]